MSDASSLKCRCPSCGSAPVALGALPDNPRFAGHRLPTQLPRSHLYRCTKCELKFRFPCLTHEEILRLYTTAESPPWNEPVAREDWRTVIDFLTPLAGSGKKIIDIGCGEGGLLSRVPDVLGRYGIEPGSLARERAAGRTQGLIFGSFDEARNHGPFDFIVLTDTLEHVVDPVQFLRQVRSILQKSGHVIVTTGDSDHWIARLLGSSWWYYKFLEHISFISDRWIQGLVQREPWHCVAFKRISHSRVRWHSIVRQVAGTLLFLASPSLLRGLGRRWSGPDFHPSPGAGIAKDHIFFVLTPRPD